MAKINLDKKNVILISVAIFLGGYILSAMLPGAGSGNKPETAFPHSRNDRAIQRYAEALAHIQQKAVFSAPLVNPRQMTASALKTYLAEQDPYSAFLTPQEYANFKAASSPGHGHIGLDVEKRRNGDIICYPVPEGPAATAGINPGDKLLALDGIPATGISLPAVIALAAGKVGTTIVIELAGRSGAHKKVTVTRSKVTQPFLSEYYFRSTRIIKLSSFTPGTKQELDYLISSWNEGKPIIIDLRGCGGGDFYAAVDSAMLFLDKGERIISVRGRSGTRSYVSTTARPPPAQRVFLWQDEFTASAAEIFIAALTENVRATSVGRTTAGKGTRQDLIELQEGGALILTTGYLITPHGVRFDGRGLAPMREIKDRIYDTKAFFNNIAALIS